MHVLQIVYFKYVKTDIMQMDMKFNATPTSSRLQVVSKLYGECIQEIKSKSVKNVKCLAKLWDLLHSSCDGVSAQSACSAIKSLVELGKLSLDNVIHKIITLISAAGNIKWLVRLAAEMLVLDFQSSASQCDVCYKKHCTSKYKLWSLPHPFISIITACPDAWPCVLNEIQNMLLESRCASSDSSSGKSLLPCNPIQIFEPLILYILCNPGQDTRAEFQAISLFSVLASTIAFAAHENSCHCTRQNANIVVLLVRAFSITCESDLNTNLIVQLLSTVHLLPLQEYDLDLNALLLNCLSLCCDLSDSPQCLNVIKTLQLLLTNHAEFNCVPLFICGVGYLICRAPLLAVSDLLHLVLLLVSHCSMAAIGQLDKGLCLLILKGSILQLLLSKNAVGYQDLHSLANQVMMVLNKEVTSLLENLEAHDEGTDQQNILLRDSILQRFFILYQVVKKTLLSQNFDQLQLTITTNSDPAFFYASSLFLSSAFSLSCRNNLSISTIDGFLGMLGHVVAVCPDTATVILPNMLNVLKIVTEPRLVRSIVFFLPELATSRECITFILKTVQALARIPSLHCLSTQIMCKLWKKENRCFPYLHQMLVSRPIGNNKLQVEFATTKFLIVKEVCEMQPHKHGSDMLKLISAALHVNILPGHAALLLDSLYLLCENEVVNIMSAWGKLEQAVVKHRSPSVTRAVLKLFSLLPKITSDSDEFRLFREGCLQKVWTAVEEKHAGVAASALVCLGHYDKTEFKIRHLPSCCRPEVPQTSEKTDGSNQASFLDMPAPGVNLVKMLLSLMPYVKEQASFFLTSILSQEVGNLPRDIRDRAMNYEKKAATPALGLDVPTFMLKTYEKNKQPNLKPTLSLGLLMCYDPKCEVDSAGKPVLRSVVTRMRKFLQMLQALLSEVVVEVKNWQGLVQLARSWKMFMKRCYEAVVQGRRCELEMQLTQNPDDRDDIQFKMSTCHLSCRDKLTDILKSTSKGTPSMQGNALLSLVGLVHCVSDHCKKQKQTPESPASETAGSGFISLEHWMSMAIDTIISIADANYRPKGRIFSWCQFRAVSGVGSLSTSQISKVCALHSFHSLVPLLLPNDVFRAGVLLDIADAFLRKTYTERCAEFIDNPSMITCVGLALGQVLFQLHQGSHGKVAQETFYCKMRRSVGMMSDVAFASQKSSDAGAHDTDKLDTTGVVLGLGHAYAAMILSNNASYVAEAKEGLKSLQTELEKSEDESLSYRNSLCTSMVWTTVAGMQANALEKSDCVAVLKQVEQLWSENQNNVTFSQTLGVLCCCLAAKSPEAKELYHELYQIWLSQLQKERAPTRQKLASISGLGALVGGGNVVAPISFETVPSNLPKVAKLLQQTVRGTKDVAVTSNAILALSQVYSYTKLHVAAPTGFPSSFGYLPESSVLKPVFDFLATSSQSSNAGVVACVEIIMESLCEVSIYHSAFPPVDWSRVIVPLLEHSQAEVFQLGCVKLSVSQCVDNPQLTAVVSSWLQSGSMNKFTAPVQDVLYESIDVFARLLPQQMTLLFLESLNGDILKLQSVARGLLKALKLPNMPSEIPRCLYALTERIYRQHDLLAEDGALMWESWTVVADCMSHCLNYELVTSPTGKNRSDCDVIKSLLVRLVLVGSGAKPPQWCSESVEECASMESECSQTLAVHTLHTACVLFKNANSVSTLKCAEWLQELISRWKDLRGSHAQQLFRVKALAAVVVSWNSELRMVAGGKFLVRTLCRGVCISGGSRGGDDRAP